MHLNLAVFVLLINCQSKLTDSLITLVVDQPDTKRVADKLDDKQKMEKLEKLVMDLAKKSWKLSSRLKDRKEQFVEIKHLGVITSKITVNSYWIVLDANSFELNERVNCGGFNVKYGKEEEISFKNANGKWITQPAISLKKATATAGMGIFVSHHSIANDEAFLLVPVQRVFEVDNGAIRMTFYGIATIAEFKRLKRNSK